MKNMNTNYNYIITQFVLNKILHRVGMSWIIETSQQLKYEIDKHNPDWITCGPQYITYISNKLHGTVFENYIINAITDRYKIMCSIDAHEKKYPQYVDDISSSGGNVLPSNFTKEVLA